jgi:DNA-binding response OmpR family regulator
VQLLVIDDNPDNRFLLAKTLLRKFPNAALVECQSIETALNLLKSVSVDLVVAHRTHELAGVDLVRELRTAHATVPIIAVSGIDKRQAILAAGATRFHLLDEWLLIGNAAAELVQASPSPEAND